jgi:acetyl-CoA carboxylase biotin carboxyl carrier protein
MNQKELRELIEFLVEKDISEFELERGDLKVRVKRGVPGPSAGSAESTVVALPLAGVQPGAAPIASAPAAGVPAAQHSGSASPAKAEGAEEAGLHTVKSPIVGTFFEAPSPGSPPFVKIGDNVEVGSVLCIVEAMKLMNEIESDTAGEIVKKLVTNGQPVEYGQSLFVIRPK